MIRGVGVGDGAGDGSGLGLGVCAREVSGTCVTATVAAPSAGSAFTKARRLLDLIFLSFTVHYVLLLVRKLPEDLAIF